MLPDSRDFMRAVDEFWGEYWPIGRVSRMEVYDDSTLDAFHLFDEWGGLTKSTFLDQGEPTSIRYNCYDRADAFAQRTTHDVEADQQTSWTYQADPLERTIIATVHSARCRSGDSFNVCVLDEDGRIVELEEGICLGGEVDRWFVEWDSFNRIENIVCTGSQGEVLLSWSYEYDEHREPIRIAQSDPKSRLVWDRRYLRSYDGYGNWIEEQETESSYKTYGAIETSINRSKRLITYRNP